MTEQLEGQMSFADLDIWSGRTCQEHYHLENRKEQISKSSSRKLSKSQSQMLPMCLCLGGGDGQNQDACTMRWGDGALLGEYTMHSFGESPRRLMDECLTSEPLNGVSESRLSQILMESAHPKYYLSVKACKGILNRADKRGKELPEILQQALQNQIHRGSCDPQN